MKNGKFYLWVALSPFLMTCGGSSKHLVVQGKVFNLADQSAVAGAHVVAFDANQSPVSSVATTDGSGDYEIALTSQVNITLRADAAGFQTFPAGLRQALPIDTSSPTENGSKLIVKTTQTDIGLIALGAGSGTGSIHGTVQVPQGATGILVVAETGSPAVGFSAIADRDGDYKIFNLAAGQYTVTAYTKGSNYTPATVTLAEGEDTQADLSTNENATSSFSGNVQIVNAPGGSATSIILVVESTFNATIVRGDNVPRSARSRCRHGTRCHRLVLDRRDSGREVRRSGGL